MLIDIVQENETLKISKVNAKKNLEFLTIRLPKTELYEWSLTPKHSGQVPDPIYKHWYKDESVYRHPTYFLNKFRIIELLTNLPKDQQEKIFEFNKPHALYCDIETEVIDKMPDPNDPKEMITVIGFFDEKDKIAKVFGIKELSRKEEMEIQKKLNTYFDKEFGQKLQFEYTHFSSEFDMLYYTFSEVIRKCLIFTGWNFINFDWKYLRARAERLGINTAICAEEGKFSGRNQLPKHKLVVDYLEIFKKWGNEHKNLDNYTLDHVSETLLKKKKIQMPEGLQWLFENDFLKYVYYNIVDVLLVYLIEEKKKTLLTMYKIAELGGLQAQDTTSPVRFGESILCRDFYKENKVLIPNYNVFDELNTKIAKETGSTKAEGGFVMIPLQGLHEGVGSGDFASLYPSIKRGINISPETLLGFDSDSDEETISQNIRTPMGTVFRKEPGILTRRLDLYYGQRKSIQSQMEKKLLRLEELKTYYKNRKI